MYTNTALYKRAKKRVVAKCKAFKQKKLYLQENAIEAGLGWLSNSVIYDAVKDNQNESLK